jgi:RimJ/RimL family protein N-acetyltransferase
LIETARLTLRPPAMADFAAYAAFWASPRSRFMGGPAGERGAWFWFCHDIAAWALFGHGALMMDRRDGGGTVGQVGINAGPLYPETELGWLLYEGAEGQGYAAEGAAALRDWAFAALGLRSLVSYIDAGNAGSVRLAARLGAVPDAAARRQDPGDLVWRHHPGGRA